MAGSQQYLRKCTLIVADEEQNGLDLSNLRIKFQVKRSDTMTPNSADIRVYNLDEATILKIQKEFTSVILQAGYDANYGVIFQGTIKQVIRGRETATDTFIDIVAGDGDRGYNFAIVKETLAPGATQLDQVNRAISSMSEKGVSAGHLGEMPPEKLPRGKVMFGNARDVLRDVAATTDKVWSIQDEKINFVDVTSYLPGEVVVLTSKTGLIGAPQQTNEGVNLKCLINPFIKIGGRVQLDNKSVQRLKINLAVPNSPANIPAPLTADGTYYVLVAEHTGDNRGVEWYTSLICLNQDVTTQPLNSVKVGYSGP